MQTYSHFINCINDYHIVGKLQDTKSSFVAFAVNHVVNHENLTHKTSTYVHAVNGENSFVLKNQINFPSTLQTTAILAPHPPPPQIPWYTAVLLLTCLAADPNVPSVGAPSVSGGILVCAEGELWVSRPACHIGHGYCLSGVTLSIGRAGEYPRICACRSRENEVKITDWYTTGLPTNHVAFPTDFLKYYFFLQTFQSIVHFQFIELGI